jgi:hypothetical protein
MLQGPHQKYDIMLLHGPNDSAVVECLADWLKKADVIVWFGKWSLIPGISRQQQIEKALQDSRACAVCLGTEPPRGWFKQAVELAYDHYAKGNFRLIPVMLPRGDRSFLDGFLQGPVEVEFSERIDDDKVLASLMAAIRPAEDHYLVVPLRKPPEVFRRIRVVFEGLDDLRKQNIIDDRTLIKNKAETLTFSIKRYLSGKEC